MGLKRSARTLPRPLQIKHAHACDYDEDGEHEDDGGNGLLVY